MVSVYSKSKIERRKILEINEDLNSVTIMMVEEKDTRKLNKRERMKKETLILLKIMRKLQKK